jgi:hypothetical protein
VIVDQQHSAFLRLNAYLWFGYHWHSPIQSRE